MMITGIISGGQTGADQAGLRAARKLSLKTGGFAPKGFGTEAGPQTWLGPTYHLVEMDTPDYRARTEMNVSVAHGTVIFGKESPGSQLTHRLCHELEKPCLWLKCDLLCLREHNPKAEFRLWVERNHIQILNCAGNRERVNPGIGIAVERFLVEVIEQINRPAVAAGA